MVVYNLPYNKRYKPENMLLAGIIPPTLKDGKKGKPKSLRPYQAAVVDQLLRAWRPGLRLVDIQGKQINRRLKLIHLIGDYPGLCELNHQTSHSGRLGCIKCWIKGQVFGGYRRNLPPDHPFRTDPAFGPPEHGEPFEEKTDFQYRTWGAAATAQAGDVKYDVNNEGGGSKV